jgi:hypothetical protein
MDTLCIPVGPDERAYRLEQIDNMASIYKGATHGLILDAELTSIAYDASRHDVHALLACSAWMTRSWTLQEGKLPSRLAVQFRDGVIVLGRRSELDRRYTQQWYAIPDDRRNPAQLVQENCSDPHQTSDPACMKERGTCDCAKLALELAIYTTFFAESVSTVPALNLALVWNELSGRSTTMSEDIPMIITNMLNMSNHSILDSQDAEHMFQTILLSLEEIPISILFKPGPRQDSAEHHQNRWVPIAIGQFGLGSMREVLRVRPAHLEFKYARAEDQDVMAFRTDHVVSIRNACYIHLGDEDALYTLEPSVATNDQFSFANFASTCLIVENPQQLVSHHDILRGACFYVHIDASPSTLKRWLNHALAKFDALWYEYVETTKAPTYTADLTYHCPFQLRRVTSIPESSLNNLSTHRFQPMNAQCNLRIKYGTSSQFIHSSPPLSLTPIKTPSESPAASL